MGYAARGPYAGPAPAPGAVNVFAPPETRGRSSDAAHGGTPTHGAFVHADRGHRLAGTRVVSSTVDSIVIIVHGDNRPGYRTRSRERELQALRGIKSGDLGERLRGVTSVPIFTLETILPTLDGPRDLFTKLVTHQPPYGQEPRVLEAVTNMLPADLEISVGDLVTYGDRGKLWERYVARYAALRTRVPYLASPGNHERTDKKLRRINWDAAMMPPAAPGQYGYAMDLPGGLARFVFLDSNLLTDSRDRYPGPVADAWSRQQLDWADSVLAAPARFKFVVLHYPLVSAGHYAKMWSPALAGRRLAARRRRLLGVCQRRRVTAVRAGHEHLYQRVYVRTPDRGGFWQVTTGGAGSPLHWVSEGARRRALDEPLGDGFEADPRSAFGFSDFHFCRLVIPRVRKAGIASPRLENCQVDSHARPHLVDILDLAHGPHGQ